MKKKILVVSICLAIMLGIAAFGYAETISGTTKWIYGGSDNITFTLDTSTGVMEFSGAGGWEGWFLNNVPWLTDLTGSFYGGYGDFSSTIRKVIIGDGITNIAGYAFNGCKNLTSVSIPESVISIGEHAFEGCTSLISIDLPSKLNKIDDGAFKSCTALKTCDIPDSVQIIGNEAFLSCESLRTVVTHADKIGNFAFARTGLLSAELYDCSQLGQHAFRESENLQSVKMDDTMTMLPDYAFRTCKSLKKVTLSSNLDSIGEGAFSQCTKLSQIEIPDGVSSIGEGAFHATALTSITIPDSVTLIETFAFKGSGKLREVKISSAIDSIPESCFQNCTALSSIKIPDGVQIIADKAFYECKALKEVTFSKNVESIGEQAFYGCESLEAVNILSTKVSSIGEAAFQNCTNLEAVILSDQLTSLNNNLFSRSGVKYISLPDTIVNIKERAFYSCDDLSNVFYWGSEEDAQDITMGSSNSSLENAAWHYNEKITSTINLKNIWDITYVWSEDNSQVTASAVCKYNSNHAITEVVNTDSQIIQEAECEVEGIREIYTNSFTHKIFTTQYRNGTVPATGHDWDDPYYDWSDDYLSCTATFECSNDWYHELNETVSSTVSYIEPTAEYPYGRTVYTAVFTTEGAVTQTHYENRGPSVTASTEPTTTPDITPTVEPAMEPTVTPIPEIPSGTVTDSKGAYEISVASDGTATATYTKPAKSAKTAIIPDTVTVTASDGSGVSVPVTSIAAGAFKGDKKLTTLTIGANVNTIGKNAFASCSKLKTVKGGENVTSIGANAFKGDKVLTSITLKNVTTIGASAFSGCVKLKTVTLGDDLTTIGAEAFKGCTALTKITLPAKVKSIGKQAFMNCSKLKTITIKSTKLKSGNVGSNAFKGIGAKAKITCPKKQLASYKKFLFKKGVPETATIK